MIRSEALILRRFRHGETSLVVHAFTRARGRVPFMAKGARAGGKRAPVPLVPLVLLEIIWKPSTRSELQILREVSLLDGFGGIQSDLERLAWAQAAVETLARILSGEEPYENLFNATVDYLSSLSESRQKQENMFLQFRLLVLREMGFAINTQIPEKYGSLVFFEPARGRVTTDHNSRNYSVPIHIGAWKLLSILDCCDRDEARRLRISPVAMKEIEGVLNSAYRLAFDGWKPLESLKLIQN